jgi:F0F1-type ATP synthase membrane subunit b/b'
MNVQDWLPTILIISSILAATLAFIWVALRLGKPAADQQKTDYGKAAERDAERIFNDEFREELRNRGRLHFEKIIGENAMFLQQDLRLTTSQINEYMKQEITKTLQEAFTTYEQSISDAKQIALESIKKTQSAVEDQRKMLSEQLTKEITEEKRRAIEQFDRNMTDIVNHYIISAIGNQIDLDDQLEFILGELERNKQSITEDIKSGA